MSTWGGASSAAGTAMSPNPPTGTCAGTSTNRRTGWPATGLSSSAATSARVRCRRSQTTLPGVVSFHVSNVAIEATDSSRAIRPWHEQGRAPTGGTLAGPSELAEFPPRIRSRRRPTTRDRLTPPHPARNEPVGACTARDATPSRLATERRISSPRHRSPDVGMILTARLPPRCGLGPLSKRCPRT